MDEEGRTYGHQRQNSRKRKVKGRKGRGEEGDQSSMSRGRGKKLLGNLEEKDKKISEKVKNMI